MKIVERIFDVTTGETIDLERDMTPEEILEHEKNQTEKDAWLKIEKENQMKREAAQAKLTALGLTADDLKALGL
jgi:hypothetical protein